MSEAVRTREARAGRAPARGLAHPVPALLTVAGGTLVLAAVLYVLALGTDRFLRVDHRLRFPQIVGDWMLRDEASFRFSQASELGFVTIGAAVLVVAVLVGGLRRAGVVAAVAVAGPAAAWALAELLATTDPVGGEALRASAGAFPSGHAAVALSLGIALVVALPPRGRAAGGIVAVLLALSVAVGVMALGWHYPSDVLGAFLISIAAAAIVLAVAAVPGAGGRSLRGRRTLAGTGVLAGGALALSAAAGAVALRLMPDEGAGAFVAAHPRFIVAVIVAGALATAGVATLAHLLGTGRLRRS